MEATVLRTQNLTARFGGHVAVNRVSCAFDAGTLTAIIGQDGAGKSAYFDLISGQLHASTGRVYLKEQDISRMPLAARTRAGIGHAIQRATLFSDLSVMDNLRLAAQTTSKHRADMWGMAHHHRARMEAAVQTLEKMNLADKRDQIVSTLSENDQRKLEVATLITRDPLVFLFDRPSAGMRPDEAQIVVELIDELKSRRDRVILLVEHNLEVIRALADRVIMLHRGCVVADGPPDAVMKLDRVRKAQIPQDQRPVLDALFPDQRKV